MTLTKFVSILFDFAFYYPFFMAYMWITGAVYYFFYRENVEKQPVDDPPVLRDSPGVTFIVPCHDEGPNVRETIGALLNQDYPDFEVIAVNDASNDDTGQILDRMALLEDRLRVIHFECQERDPRLHRRRRHPRPARRALAGVAFRQRAARGRGDRQPARA